MISFSKTIPPPVGMLIVASFGVRSRPSAARRTFTISSLPERTGDAPESSERLAVLLPGTPAPGVSSADRYVTIDEDGGVVDMLRLRESAAEFARGEGELIDLNTLWERFGPPGDE